MLRTIALYAVALAGAAFILAWLEYQYVVRLFAVEIYILLIAAGFTAFGVWVGRRLTRATRTVAFERNETAIQTLGITNREYEVLVALAAGQTNKEIARTLKISPNTIKSHVARLFDKLEATRRTQAVDKARRLQLIP